MAALVLYKANYFVNDLFLNERSLAIGLIFILEHYRKLVLWNEAIRHRSVVWATPSVSCTDWAACEDSSRCVLLSFIFFCLESVSADQISCVY
jgi:hypothetical protein